MKGFFLFRDKLTRKHIACKVQLKRNWNAHILMLLKSEIIMSEWDGFDVFFFFLLLMYFVLTLRTCLDYHNNKENIHSLSLSLFYYGYFDGYKQDKRCLRSILALGKESSFCFSLNISIYCICESKKSSIEDKNHS